VRTPEIVINGRFLGQRVTGVQRYARETLLCLDELLAQGEGAWARWTLVVPRGAEMRDLRCIAVEETGRTRGHLWEQVELGWRARNALLVSFGFTGPLALRNQIVTIHDANVIRMPQSFGRCFRVWYRFIVPRVVGRSAMTIAVSQFSASEAEQCYGARPQALRIASEGWQHLDRVKSDPALLDRHSLRGKPFALAVSSPSANKNFGAIAEALRILGKAAPLCVAAGAVDSGVLRRVDTPSTSILPLGYVADAELKALYEHATCFVYPSFYEGFGIPPLEAMACGCPVIASTAPALREVCGDAALYFDPRDPRALAACFEQVFASAPLRSRMAAAGRCRAQEYSWMAAARLNLKYIDECLRARSVRLDSQVSCRA
jgi:glycosyltransferase involved in cell wall biosynthesis